MLHGSQASPLPPPPLASAVEQHQRATAYSQQVHQHISSTTTGTVPLPGNQVRGAAAGEYYGSMPPTPDRDGYLLPRPSASSASMVPTRGSAGADLLRMLHQGGGSAPLPTSTRVPAATSSILTPQEAQQPLPPPPISTPRKVAAEQERFLRNFLSIGENNNAPSTGQAGAPSVVAPATPSSSSASVSAASPSATVLAGPVANGRTGRGKDKAARGRGKDKGRGREHRSGAHERGKSGSGGGTPGPAESSRGRGQGRGARGHGRAGKDYGRREAKNSNKGGKGGTGKGAPSPQTPSSYAWSRFQNSPDPHTIPIPSLQGNVIIPQVSEEVHDGVASATSPSYSAWPNGAAASQPGRGGAPEGRQEQQQAMVMQTPPPAARPQASTGRGGRSSAKKAEDDIKRMLRLK